MLAVLPFENLSGDEEQEYFGDGLTDEMIAQLGRLNPARLGGIARTSWACNVSWHRRLAARFACSAVRSGSRFKTPVRRMNFPLA